MARPLFMQGCYNESDNAPTQKQQSDYVRGIRICRVMYMEGIK